MRRLSWLLCFLLAPVMAHAQATWVPGGATAAGLQAVSIVAGQASAGQYPTTLYPWLVPQVAWLDGAHYACANGATCDSVVVPAASLQSLHGLTFTAAGIASANSGSTKSVKFVIVSGGVSTTIDSVKVTASDADNWFLRCTILIRTPGSASPQPYNCEGAHMIPGGYVFNALATRDTVTLNPTAAIVIKTVTTDSVAGDVAQDLFTGVRQP